MNKKINEKKSFKCKNGVGRQQWTFTSCQNAACSDDFFLWWVDYALEENVLTGQM